MEYPEERQKRKNFENRELTRMRTTRIEDWKNRKMEMKESWKSHPRENMTLHISRIV